VTDPIGVSPVRPAAEPPRWGSFGHHYSSLTGYNFLSLSLALGIVKRQSMVAQAAFRSDYQAPISYATIIWLPIWVSEINSAFSASFKSTMNFFAIANSFLAFGEF
jgi:hypothetical protein